MQFPWPLNESWNEMHGLPTLLKTNNDQRHGDTFPGGMRCKFESVSKIFYILLGDLKI